MKVIVPCAGRSLRFPKELPKWMLPAHDGTPMIKLAVAGLNFSLDDLIVTILKEHDEQFDASNGIRSAFHHAVQIIVLDQPTSSQSETVAKTLELAEIEEPFLVKDSDNCFSIPDINALHNYVSVASLNDFDQINPRNKSYVQIDHEGVITNFREKKVISDLFSVGGYFFADARAFRDVFDKLNNDPTFDGPELYLSEIISHMILHGTPFCVCRVSDYQDWGTIHEWRHKMDARRTYFVALDGFVFERGSRFFAPRFEDVKPNESAVHAIKAIAGQGHAIVYLTVRPQQLNEMTREQIVIAGLPEGQILFDCPVSRWQLVTAPHSTLPFRTSSAFELSPDEPLLREKLELD